MQMGLIRQGWALDLPERLEALSSPVARLSEVKGRLEKIVYPSLYKDVFE